MSARHNGRKPRKAVQPATIRRIAAQIKRMSDADAYALTFAESRYIRDLAMQACHARAESYALSEG